MTKREFSREALARAKRSSDALALAGRLAVASNRVLKASAEDLGPAMSALRTTLHDYDQFIIAWSREGK